MIPDQDIEFDATTNKLFRRRRMATETLVSGSHLRDALTDVQASELLDWALFRLDQDLGQTILMPDEEADRWVDDWLTAVTGIMKGINRLVSKLNVYDWDEATYQTDAFWAHLQQIPGSSEYGSAGELLTNLRHLPDGNAIFRQLMELITQQDEEE